MATTVARLEAILTADTGQYTRKMREAEGQTKRIGGVMNTAKIAAAGFAVAGIGLAAEGLKKSVEAALAAQKSQERLQVAFRNAHLELKLYESRIGAVEAASRKLGFTDEDVKNSLGSLITATGSYRESVKELGIAQDLARFKGVSLEQGTKALTMAHAGSLRALKQLGIEVPKVTAAQDALKAAYKDHTSAAYDNALATAKVADKQATVANVMQTVTDRVHGQADAYSKTAQGAMEQFHAQLQHIEVTIGTTLIPAMTKMIAALNRVLIWLQENWPQISATVKKVMDTLRPIIEPVLKTILALFQTIGTLIRGDWSGVWDGIKKIVVSVFNGVEAEIRFEINVIRTLLTALGEAALAGLRAGLSGVRQLVFNYVINPFVGAIEDGASAVKHAITGLFGKVIDWAKGALGIGSPSAVFHEIGQNVIRGFVNGVGSMAGVLKNAVVGMAMSAVSHLNPFAGGTRVAPSKGSEGALGSGGPAEARKFAISQLSRFGWGSDQFGPLNSLWNQESGWNRFAKNASSGAYGIPQAYPASKMPFAAQAAGGSNMVAQVMWGLNYIKGRYGSPSRAWAQDVAGGLKGYARGGIVDSVPAMLTPGEMVLNRSQQNMLGGPGRLAGMFGFGPPRSGAFAGGGMAGGDTIVVPLNIDGNELARVMIDPIRRKAQVFNRRNGRRAF